MLKFLSFLFLYRAERKQLQRKKTASSSETSPSPSEFPEITLEDDTVDTTVFIVSNIGDNNSPCPTIESIDIDVLLEPEGGIVLTFVLFQKKPVPSPK